MDDDIEGVTAIVPNPSERLTTSRFVQDLICSQDDALHPCSMWGPQSYIKFAAEYFL